MNATRSKVVLVPLPPAVGRAIDRTIADRASGPILLNTRSARTDRHAADRPICRDETLPCSQAGTIA
jgi:hypothetical protein